MDLSIVIPRVLFGPIFRGSITANRRLYQQKWRGLKLGRLSAGAAENRTKVYTPRSGAHLPARLYLDRAHDRDQHHPDPDLGGGPDLYAVHPALPRGGAARRSFRAALLH